MKKQFAVSLVAAVLIATIAMLWMRVCTLESQVQALIKRLPNEPVMLRVSQPFLGTPTPAERPQKSPFKLIDSPSDTHKSKVGVPWSVERAMIDRANQKIVPKR